MKNVLIVSGHRDSDNDSVANKQIIKDLKELLPDAEINILDKLYPDYKIDVKSEQEKLEIEIANKQQLDNIITKFRTIKDTIEVKRSSTKKI